VKSIGAALKAHMAGDSTVATCWKITRKDAQEFFFTDHVVDLTVDGDAYEADKGMIASAQRADRSLRVDDMEAVSFVETGKVTKADVAAGLFDYGTVDVFLVNYEDLTQGKLWLAQGWMLGEVKLGDLGFTAELTGKARKLEQSIVESCSPTCRAKFGDSRCTVDATDYQYNESSSVSAVTDNQIFTASLTVPSDDLTVFDYGKVTWTSGANNGLEMEIRQYTGGVVTLFLSMPYDVAVADAFDARWGCSKLPAICDSRYSNILNFRGEPYVPVEGEIPMARPAGRHRRTQQRRRRLWQRS
jgi:uncharacterized phage protein (TIGR02218 family)